MPYECNSLQDFFLAADGSEKIIAKLTTEELYIANSQFFYRERKPSKETLEAVTEWIQNRSVIKIKGYKRPEEIL